MPAETRTACRAGHDGARVHQVSTYPARTASFRMAWLPGVTMNRVPGDLLILDDLGRDGEVAQPAIGAGSDERLVDVLSHNVG